MSLSDLIAKRSDTSVSGEGGVKESSPGTRSADVASVDEGKATSASPPAETEDPINQASEPDGEEPYGVSQVVTPSGIEIYYQAGPKRLYKVNGRQKPSVSEVLDILERGGLSWWGMKVGIDGYIALLTRAMHDDPMRWDKWLFATPTDEIVAEMKTMGLTVHQVRDKAGDRGTSVHTALEGWADTGNLPHPEVYAEEERGFVEGLCKALIDSGGIPEASERMVASKKHGFAGRYDLDITIPNGAEMFTHITPKGRGDKKERIEGGLWRWDLKTSGAVYESYHMQIEGYEEGCVESGYGPSDHRGVLRVTADGRYELKESKATFADFKAVLGAYKRLERLKAR